MWDEERRVPTPESKILTPHPLTHFPTPPLRMYYYIYDTFLTDKKYERVLAAVETRLTDLGISGKIGRLTPFTNARGLIRDEIRRGVETVIVVGNDETVAKVVEGIGDAKLTLGIIPIGTSISIARSLGIPEGADACDVLSKRLTQKIDLGMVNGRFFLSQVRFTGSNVSLESDGKFRVSMPATDCDVIISNLRRKQTDEEGGGYAAGDPMDGWLDALITPRSGGIMQVFQRKEQRTASVIPIRRISVTSPEPFSVIADGREFMNDTLSIEVVPEKLRIITGRMRVFA